MDGNLDIHIGLQADDAALVHASRNGSEKAFEAIFKRHSERLWRYACGLTRDFDDAQDLIQETFMHAYQHLHSLKSSQALGSWLTTLMYRLAAGRHVQSRSRSELLNAHLAPGLPPPTSAATPFQNPEDAYASQELGEAIRRALDRLTETSRRTFIAFHVEGRSLIDISEELGISMGAVKGRLFHTRERLRKELEMMAPEQTIPAEMPERLSIFTCGEECHKDAPLHPIRLTERLLPRRLLFACRKAPKSETELAKFLQVDRAYVDDIVPDLIRGEVLEEAAPGTYETPFFFATKEDLDTLVQSVSVATEGLPILQKRLPELQRALEGADLVRRQGYDWSYLGWIAIPIWIALRGLGRQVDRLPTWGRHRILVYPLRPVDHWHLLGLADTDARSILNVGARSSEGSESGFGIVAAARESLVDLREMIDFEHQERYVGRLARGPRTEAEILEGAQDLSAERERLARYTELGFIASIGDGKFRLNVPVVNAEDDAALVEVVDKICEELAGRFLDKTLSVFAQKVRDLGFEHLLQEPHYVGFIGLIVTASELVRACIEANLLVRPRMPGPAFGCWAWHRAPRLVRSWSKGR